MDRPNLFSLLTLFIGIFLGNRIRLGSEAAQRRRIFRNCISCLIENMQGTDVEQLRQAHQNSISQITTESVNIREDIRRWNRNKFNKAWRAYCNTANKDFSKTDEWLAGMATEPGMGSDYKLVRDDLLRELRLIVKYAA